MRQFTQNLRTGETHLLDVPAPLLRPGGVLVRTHYSVISVGTERMKLELGRKSLLGKARERPDQVRKVLETLGRDGLAATVQKVRSRLNSLSPFGYSCAGMVEGVGRGARGFQTGDYVACAGAGYANHAELIWAPVNLVSAIPDGVPLDHAAFATIGAIGLQGLRQADVALGDVVAVIGLGIVGQITLQLLGAAGAVAIGIDTDNSRVALAERLGFPSLSRANDVIEFVGARSAGRGADAVIITASASSADPVELAGELCRDRGRVVVIGSVPVQAPRSLFYDKELELRLSRSYGPGRYDPEYEEKGHDYPAGYVRWTEGRNLGEILRLLSCGGLKLGPLITRRYAFADIERAYADLDSTGALGVVVEYDTALREAPQRIQVREPFPGDGSAHVKGVKSTVSRSSVAVTDRVHLGFIGAGNFATGVLLPALKGLDIELRGVASASGLSARGVAQHFGFGYVAADAAELLADDEIHAVIITTRHAEHASLARAALEAGKAVFVEKPLALTDEDLDSVLTAAMGPAHMTGKEQGSDESDIAANGAGPHAIGPLLMVGFNRRFAPATVFLRERLANVVGARVVLARVNAGAVPAGNWVHDPEQGGGRLVGEGCHFIDLVTHLVGAAPIDVSTTGLGAEDPAARLGDNVQVTMRYADGSLASVLYTSKGNARAGKERIEVFAGGRTAFIDDFRRAEVRGTRRHRWKGRQDKGHSGELKAFIEAVRSGGLAPIPLAELEVSSRATLRAERALRTGRAERL